MYWKSLEGILTRYVRHNDNKFDYIDHITQRKHIVINRVRYIGKEFNNLDKSQILGIDNDSYLEYGNLKEFYECVIAQKP